MNVVILSDFETQGGAAIAASRLAQGLCDAGTNVTRIVGHADLKQHSWETSRLVSDHTIFDRMLRKMTSSVANIKSDQKEILNRIHQLLRSIRPDIINVHNIHGALHLGWSIELLHVCQQYAPTVWTLHDMWSFTGRCAYSYDCKKFVTGCDSSCPTPWEYPAVSPEKIAEEWNSRKRLFAEASNLTFIAPSQWMAEEASSGLLNGFQIDVIPYGLPLNVFESRNHSQARLEFGCKPDQLVIMAAAENLQDRRKGGSYLQNGLALIRDEITLITMGEGDLNISSEFVSVHSLGYVEDVSKTVEAYNAADILVHPAPVDNFPNVVLEALACGTPVVAFPVGGLTEMVRPGITGWLTPEVTSQSLADTLLKALDDLKQGKNLRASCRKVAEEKYGMKTQTVKYLELFSSLCDRKRQNEKIK